jgi:hypothetical protein
MHAGQALINVGVLAPQGVAGGWFGMTPVAHPLKIG